MNQQQKPMENRVTDLVEICSEGLYEREEIVAISLLSTLSGQSIFLYGLPGTAKSLIARRLSHIFKDTTHFEYLMQRFSTPEDVFGPVSIHELKKDNYIRKTEGYLPDADFAFLDEIWKSSPAILNTLLTIINERVYRNGGNEKKVPLKALIAASNETPPSNQGLEALYDRFIMRIIVNPMQERHNFEKLLDGEPVPADINIPEELQFSHEEWEQIFNEASKVKISEEVFSIINSIKVLLDGFNETNPEIAVYISDRRWQKIALILKTAAFLCDRSEVIPVDTLILRHCLWTLEENREPVNEIIEDCVQQFGSVNRDKLNAWEVNHKDLESGVSDTFYYSEDIYDTEKIDNIECFPVISPEISKRKNTLFIGDVENDKIKVRLYLPIKYIDTSTSFNPFDEEGNCEKRVECNFNGTKSCEVKIKENIYEMGWDHEYIYKARQYIHWFDAAPPIKIKKGTQKSVDSRVKNTFLKACEDSLESIEEIIVDTTAYVESQRKLNETPFVPIEKSELVLDSLNSFLKDLENHKLNAEHLLEKVQSHAISKS